MIRVWPIGNLGESPENNYQATLFDYLYSKGVREKLLAETERQIKFVLQGISKPENVVGATFLEELPGHFTSGPFGLPWAEWKKGDPLPWDMKPFQREIEKELGEPFDLKNQKHRRWWGRKYAQVLSEIHRTMKTALAGRSVLYYQHPIYRSMDWGAERGARSVATDPLLLPIYYKEIVNPRGADGFFGYPNNAAIWSRQTQKPAMALNCYVFSQISIPPNMRLSSLEEMTRLARWPYSRNLGSFLFPTEGRKTRAANEVSYQDDSYWTAPDHIRRFGWDNRINLEIVKRGLSPAIALQYDLTGAKPNQPFQVQGTVWNPRDPSWYGGDSDLAALKDVVLSLEIPGGFRFLAGSERVSSISLGDIAPRSARGVTWLLVPDGANQQLAPGEFFRAVAKAEDGAQGNATSSEASEAPPLYVPHLVSRSGERWMEPARTTEDISEVELRSLGPDIVKPSLQRDGRTTRLTYLGTLRSNSRLVIGPGPRAVLYVTDLFDEATRRFSPNKPGPTGAVEFSHGYGVFAATGPLVHTGERYRVSVTGWAKEGGNCLVVARFNGVQAGKPSFHDLVLLSGALTQTRSTVESNEFEVPPFDAGRTRLTLYFYRLSDRGSVYYESFDCRRADVPDRGTDVSDRLSGELSRLESPFSLWTYTDSSDPGQWGRPKLQLRFLPTQGAKVKQ